MNRFAGRVAKGVSLLLAIATLSLAAPLVNSAQATATVAGVPSAPLHVVTSNATLTALDVSWTEPVSVGSSPISDYTIEYRKVGGLSWTTVSHTASTATSITVTGLDPGSTHEFRVAAVNAGGTGSWNVQQIDVDAGGKSSCALIAGRGYGSERAFVSERIQDGKQR